MRSVRHFEELEVYKMAFDAAMAIFDLSKSWPAEERLSLTDQSRRSSRSICSKIAEAWKKRGSIHEFTNRLTDADGAVAELENRLNFALACGYLDSQNYDHLREKYRVTSAGLVQMITNAQAWCEPA